MNNKAEDDENMEYYKQYSSNTIGNPRASKREI